MNSYERSLAFPPTALTAPATGRFTATDWSLAQDADRSDATKTRKYPRIVLSLRGFCSRRCVRGGRTDAHKPWPSDFELCVQQAVGVGSRQSTFILVPTVVITYTYVCLRKTPRWSDSLFWVWSFYALLRNMLLTSFSCLVRWFYRLSGLPVWLANFASWRSIVI